MLTVETPDFAEEVPHDESSNGEVDESSPQAKSCADAKLCAKVWATICTYVQSLELHTS